MSQQIKSADEQELDFSHVSSKIKNYFSKFNDSFFEIFLFFRKYKFVISFLFIAGVAMGIYKDRKKVYKHEMIIMPNFGSVDYIYGRVDLLNSKIKERDTIFFKKIGVKGVEKLREIEVEPITNVYQFANLKPINFEVLKVMAENNDISKVIDEETTSKNYSTHMITIHTQGTISDNTTIEPIYKYLNSNEYYSAIKNQDTENIINKMAANDSIINQINKIVREFINTPLTSRNDKLVYYNDNTQLNDLIKTKEWLIKEQGELKVSLINTSDIVRENSRTINILNTKSLVGLYKIILPFLFILLFVIFMSFKRYIRTQKIKRNLL